ncbi:putative 2-aminoethylphosphonate ABC transporter substrate-binding protein [Rhodovibrionaceae bacterium A322]
MKTGFFGRTSLMAATAAVALMAGQAAAGELTVYTAVEADDLKKYAERFNAAHPDIKINWVRDSTGIITAKLLAEKDNPQADVIWGLAGSSLLVMKSEGMLEAYAPKGVEMLNKKFVDSANPPYWVGMDAWVASVCVNTVEAEKNNLSMPATWKDLLKPEYKGHVVMPNPNSSGTGFLDVSSWLQMFGEKDGWAYMDGLHENIATYTHSGSKPCRMAAAGEYPIGVSFAYRGAKVKTKGAPVEVVVPAEGVGWEMEAAAIVKGTQNPEDAEVLMDWAVSKDAMELYNEGYAVVAIDGVAKPVENFPENLGEAMINNDFEWSANNRSAILEEWQKRYDSKSEPKG